MEIRSGGKDVKARHWRVMINERLSMEDGMEEDGGGKSKRMRINIKD